MLQGDGVPPAHEGPAKTLLDLLPDASARYIPPPPRGRNWFTRHWYGELTLAMSFWVNGLLGNILVTAVTFVLGVLVTFSDRPQLLCVALVASWSIGLPVAIWQWVGTWRSATQETLEDPSTSWPQFTKVFIVVSVLGSAAATYYVTWPQLLDSIAFAKGDPDEPARGVRILGDSGEIEISGFIGGDLPAKLEAALAQVQNATTVHLDSPGGRLGPANELAGIVRAHHLDTYVRNGCASACTLILLAGRNRYADSGAQIGFHRASFGGVDSALENFAFMDDYRRVGVSETFLEQIAATPAASIWVPRIDLLVRYKLLTAIVPPGRFRLSGFGPAPTPESIAAQLAVDPMIEGLRRFDPAGWKSVETVWVDAVENAKASDGLYTTLADHVRAAVVHALPIATDEDISIYASAYSNVLVALRKADPEMCWQFLTSTKVELARYVDTRTLSTFFEAQDGLMADAGKGPPPPVLDDAEEHEELTRLFKIRRIDPAPVFAGMQPKAPHAAACSSAIVILQSVVGFIPLDEGGPILRGLFKK